MQILGALDGNQGRIPIQLCYVDIILNGRKVRALLNIGASRNFLKKGMTMELRLRAQPCGASIKALNSKEEVVSRIMAKVHLELVNWKG